MDFDNVTGLIGISDSDFQIDENLALNTSSNYTGISEPLPDSLPMYLRITVSIFIVILLGVGTVGNTMIALVISCSRDMRTSTNFFLVNLSVADLLVLILVTPTALLEVIYHPEIWMLGQTLCYLVPVLEMTVCHASVLTILAISFERYYAICSPLKANYVCTRARAMYICIVVWFVACIITSPMFFMTLYYETRNENGVLEPKCIVGAGSFWPDFYTLTSIVIFFLVPLIILVITYGIIAHRLTQDRSALNAKNENNRGRKQVVLMLGTVVFTFFLCLLPFRILTLAVLVTDYGSFLQKHTDAYYTIAYFARIMSYVNSALNPILYNIMSSKFRNGFLRLCGRRRKQFIFHRNGTFLTLTTTTSNTLSLGTNNNFNGNCHGPLSTYSSTPPSTSPELLANTGSTVTGLIRKNGIRKSSHQKHFPQNKLAQHLAPSKQLGQPYHHHRAVSGHGTGMGGGSMISRNSSAVNGGVTRRTQSNSLDSKVLNPRTLSKKFIYSYVSGHKSDSML